MSSLALLIVLAALLGVLLSVLAARATRLFTLRAEHGRVTRVRGRLSAALLRDLEAVLGRARATGRIVVRRSRGAAVVEVSRGIDQGTLQQLRNVIGTVPLQRLATASPLRRDRD